MAKKITFWTATILWMWVIFAFSAQPAIQSDAVSLGIVEKIISFIRNIKYIPAFSWVDTDSIADFVGVMNHYVRKAAHFTVFAILGVIVYNLFASYDIDRRKAVLFTALVCLVYAISDEIHQLFVPGRAGMVKDVMIDFSGSLTALGVIYHMFGKKVRKEMA